MDDIRKLSDDDLLPVNLTGNMSDNGSDGIYENIVGWLSFYGITELNSIDARRRVLQAIEEHPTKMRYTANGNVYSFGVNLRKAKSNMGLTTLFDTLAEGIEYYNRKYGIAVLQRIAKRKTNRLSFINALLYLCAISEEATLERFAAAVVSIGNDIITANTSRRFGFYIHGGKHIGKSDRFNEGGLSKVIEDISPSLAGSYSLQDNYPISYHAAAAHYRCIDDCCNSSEMSSSAKRLLQALPRPATIRVEEKYRPARWVQSCGANVILDNHDSRTFIDDINWVRLLCGSPTRIADYEKGKSAKCWLTVFRAMSFAKKGTNEALYKMLIKESIASELKNSGNRSIEAMAKLLLAVNKCIELERYSLAELRVMFSQMRGKARFTQCWKVVAPIFDLPDDPRNYYAKKDLPLVSMQEWLLDYVSGGETDESYNEDEKDPQSEKVFLDKIAAFVDEYFDFGDDLEGMETEVDIESIKADVRSELLKDINRQFNTELPALVDVKSKSKSKSKSESKTPYQHLHNYLKKIEKGTSKLHAAIPTLCKLFSEYKPDGNGNDFRQEVLQHLTPDRLETHEWKECFDRIDGKQASVSSKYDWSSDDNKPASEYTITLSDKEIDARERYGNIKLYYYGVNKGTPEKTITVNEHASLESNVFRTELSEKVFNIRDGKSKKVDMPAVAVSMECDGNLSVKRKKDTAKSNGLICIDIDNVPKEKQDIVKRKIISFPYVFRTSISVSGKGVYAICAYNPALNHDEVMQAIGDDFAKAGIPAIDTACSDITRLRFLTRDTATLFNAFIRPIEKIVKEDCVCM